MKQRNRLLTTALAAALLLTGCGAPPEETHGTLPPSTTAPDLFTEPETPEKSDYLQSAGTEFPVFPILGNWGCSFSGDRHIDEKLGQYYIYEGGEMCLTFEMDAEGSNALLDAGVMFHLNGIPQPYRLEGETEYRYFHTFPYEGEVHNGEPYMKREEKIYFIPVDGQEGDVLTLSMLTIRNSEYLEKEPVHIPDCLFSVLGMERQIRFDETPEPFDYEKPPVLLSNLSTSYVDCTQEEIGSWTAEKLQGDREMYMYVNDLPVSWDDPDFDGNIYGISSDKPIKLRFEVWGSPHFTYGLTFYVNHEPVTAEGLDMIPVEIHNGQKTVIEAELILPDFDGDSIIYAGLIPQNSWMSPIENACYASLIHQQLQLLDLADRKELDAERMKRLEEQRSGE